MREAVLYPTRDASLRFGDQRQGGLTEGMSDTGSWVSLGPYSKIQNVRPHWKKNAHEQNHVT